jgi:hypothetical protein
MLIGQPLRRLDLPPPTPPRPQIQSLPFLKTLAASWMRLYQAGQKLQEKKQQF